MSKKHAYDYEAGYRDGSINYELEHCPSCKNIVDLQDALDKNAKLRKLVQSVLVLQHDPVYKWLDATIAEIYGKSFTEQAQELGVK